MTTAKKYILYRALCHLYFYAAISVPYYIWRELSISEAYSITAINSFLVVLLEYPTGIIGDKFGHKTSVTLSLLLWVVGLVLLALPLPYFGYLLATIFTAIGSALESGSDIALLKTNSTNFKKDLANYKAVTIGAMAVSAVFAGYLTQIWQPLPILATAVTSGIGGILIYIEKFKEVKNEKGNVFAIAKEGFLHVKKTPFLVLLLLVSGIFAGYQGSLKYVLNSFPTVFSYDLTLVTWVIAGSFILRSIGYKLSERMGNINEKILIGAVLFVMTVTILLAGVPYFPLFALPLLNFLIAILNFQMTIEINDATTDGIRASVLSLNGLIARLYSAIYILLVGYLLEFFSFTIMMVATLLFFLGMSSIYIIGQKESVRYNKS